MPTLNGRQYSGVPGLNIRKANGCIRFETPSITPTTTSGERILYVNSSNQLIFDSGASSTTLGSAGSVANFSLNDAYDDGSSITVDGAAVTLAGSHATNNVLAITLSGTGTGNMIDIQNSGTGTDGYDIIGTDDAWYVSSAGALTAASVAAASLTAPANLTINATGAGTITLAGTSTGAITLTRATTCGAALTVTTTLTVGTGATFSDGSVTMTDNANDASTLKITNDTQSTYGNASDAGMVMFTSETLTTGALLHLSLDETNLTTGSYLRCWGQDASAAVFSVGEYGATTISGAAGSNIVTVTAGDVSIADGSITLADNDNAAALSITNDTVTTVGAAADSGLVHITSETLSTGIMLNLSADETALSTGFYLRCYGQDAAAAVFTVGEYGATVVTTTGNVTSLTLTSGSTTADVLSIATTALTTGDAVQITSNAETLAAGELLKIANTESGDLSTTPKTGNLVSITSSVTATTADTTLDYDAMLISRSNIMNQGTKTLTASGSVLKLMNTSTDTAGTCTDTTVLLEILQVEGGTAAPTGDCVKVTSVGVGAKAINVVSASTTVSDMLITGSGAKANNKACLEISSTGATAAGGSLFRVAHGGTGVPGAATSYLVDFDYTSATMTNNPVTVYICSGSSTGAALNITGSGAGYSLATYMTGTGATGVQWFAEQTSTGSAADNDVVFTLHMAGLDDADATNTYGKIICTAIDVSAGTEDGKLDLQVSVGGTSTSLLYVQSSTAGATTCVVGAAASTFAGSAAGTAALTVTNGDISLSAGKFISTTTADIYGLDITVNKATATQGVVVFTNASTTSGKSVLELEQADLDKPYIKVSGATAITSATAGANGDVPAQVVGYLNVDVDGTERRIPYYAA